MRPEEFIINSDYATLKNDNSGSLSITLPNTLNIPGNTVYSTSSTITLGVQGSSVRARIMSTKDNNWYALNSVVPYIYTSGAVVSGSSVGYNVFVSLTRIDATTLRLLVTIPNNYGTTMAISGLAQTITGVVATFIPPYP